MNNTPDLTLKEVYEPIIAVAAKYAPDGEPERTNADLIMHLACQLATNLGILVEVLGAGKCALHGKTFTLKLELSPDSVVTEDRFKDLQEETK